MVTKLKNNLSYIQYIRKKMANNFPVWKEYGEVAYQGQINDNFWIGYIGNILGYPDSISKVSFVKDRGLLELRIEDKDNNPVELGYLLYNGILKTIHDQDPRWRLSLCIELIDYYVDFLKLYFEKAKDDQ